MYREPLNNLQIIEYLKRTKEDTTIEEHRMALDASIHVFENRSNLEMPETPEINIKMNRRMADDLLSFVKQTITNAEEGLNEVNSEDKLLVGVWKNGLKFWNDIKDAIVHAQGRVTKSTSPLCEAWFSI